MLRQMHRSLAFLLTFAVLSLSQAEAADFARSTVQARARCALGPGEIAYSMEGRRSGDEEPTTFCPAPGQPLDANLMGPTGCPARAFHLMNFSVDDPKLGIAFEYSCDAAPFGRQPRRVNGTDCTDLSQYVRGFVIDLSGPKRDEYVLTYRCWSASFKACGRNIKDHGEKAAGEWCGFDQESPNPWSRWWITRVSIHLRRR